MLRQVRLGKGQGFQISRASCLPFFGSSRWVRPLVGVSLNIMIKLAASGDMKGDLNSCPELKLGSPDENHES